MPIEPDTKDWTWVLRRPCPECGFDASDYPRASIGEVVRSTAAAWASELDRPDAAARSREDRWSVLEYACHVRDVFQVFDVRLGLLLTEEDPGFADWDQDRAATEGRYAGQDPATVQTELEESAAVLARHFDTVTGDQWERTGRRSNGSEFTVGTLGTYLIHDPIHHLWDVSSR